MFRTVKTMMVAGMIAAGLLLVTEPASAYYLNSWTLIHPMYCETIHFDQGVILYVHDANDAAAVVATGYNSPEISALLKKCDDGSPFYAWYGDEQGFSAWTSFYTYPGLQ